MVVHTLTNFKEKKMEFIGWLEFTIWWTFFVSTTAAMITLLVVFKYPYPLSVEEDPRHEQRVYEYLVGIYVTTVFVEIVLSLWLKMNYYLFPWRIVKKIN